MRWQMLHPYLHAMGISAWSLKNAAANFTPGLLYQSFNLFCEHNEPRGVLLIDRSAAYAEFDNKVESLVDAMLQAIKLRRLAWPQNGKNSNKNYLIMGEALAQSILSTSIPLADLRLQNVYTTHTAKALVATYHPLDLLRQPGNKRNAWEDLKKFAQLCG